MRTTRRQFLKTGLGCAAGLAATKNLVMALEQAKIPIAFQLYTVRGEFAQDVPGTLKKLKEIGYQAVEFWGYSGTPNVYEKYSAAELRKFLDDNGLKCCGVHLDLNAISKDNLQRTIANNQALGSEYLNVASAKEKMESEAGIAELAEILNQTAKVLKPLKLFTGYHAHNFDCKKINSRFAWDLLFSRTEPEVNMQMDVGNCLDGDGDPVALLKKFPGRTKSIHIKEHKEKTFESDFYKEVFRLCETSHGTKWYIVEMGGLLGNGFDVPREAFQKLKRLGK